MNKWGRPRLSVAKLADEDMLCCWDRIGLRRNSGVASTTGSRELAAGCSGLRVMPRHAVPHVVVRCGAVRWGSLEAWDRGLGWQCMHVE